VHAARGFTLLEVLVAFTVLALAMGALMQVFSRGVNNADVADRYAKAAMVAESLLASTGIEETLAEGETNGETEGYQWRRSVKLYVSGTEVPSPSTLELNAQANAAARGIATAPSAATINPASTGATLGNVDVDSLLIVRLYEIEVSVAFTTDDGRTRAVTLNTMKIGPRV
jgi:type II secretion system protein I